MEKKRFLSGIARITYPPGPPHGPNSGNLVLFSDVKVQDLKVTSGLKGRYIQPEKQLKVLYIGIFEEIDSFY